MITDKAKSHPGLFIVHRVDEKVYYEIPRAMLNRVMLWFRIGPSGVADRILSNQRSRPARLLEDARIKRLADSQDLSPLQAYTAYQLVNDIQVGILSELAMPHPVIDPYRRNLKRAFLDTLRPVLVGDATAGTELRPIARGALRELARLINTAEPKTVDRETMLHLQDSRTQMERILNPKS